MPYAADDDELESASRPSLRYNWLVNLQENKTRNDLVKTDGEI